MSENLEKTIASWGAFGHTLMKEKRIPFEKMMAEVTEYKMDSKMQSAGLEDHALILALILEQQEIIAKLQGKIAELNQGTGIQKTELQS